jgi:hypothetical protein
MAVHETGGGLEHSEMQETPPAHGEAPCDAAPATGWQAYNLDTLIQVLDA